MGLALASNREETAVHRQGDAGDVAGHVGGEENDGTDEVLRLADTAQGDARHEALQARGVLARGGRHGRGDDTGRQRVDAHAEGRQLLRERLCEHLDRALGGRIAERGGLPRVGRDGGHVDDAAARGLERIEQRVRDVEGAVHVHVERLPEVLGRARAGRGLADDDAGVVDEQVDLANALRDLARDVAAGLGRGDVEREGPGLAAGLAHQARGLFHGGGVHVGGDDARTGLRQAQAEGAAVALAGAGDEGQAALQQARREGVGVGGHGGALRRWGPALLSLRRWPSPAARPWRVHYPRCSRR